MAIKINNLNAQNNKGQTYVDLHLDMKTVQKDGGKGMSDNIVEGNDIVVDADTSALRNALINLMTTSKGERPLNLGFGIDLYKFIGDPITEITARAIGAEIQRGIDIWEPRVELLDIYIIPNIDELMYEIILIVNPLYLDDEELVLAGSLAQEKGFRFIQKRLEETYEKDDNVIYA